jgi:hypothetical protein
MNVSRDRRTEKRRAGIGKCDISNGEKAINGYKKVPLESV